MSARTASPRSPTLRNVQDWPRNEVLLLCVVAAVAVQGAVPQGDVQSIVVSVLLGTILIGAFRVAQAKGWVLISADVFAVAGVTVAILHAAGAAIGQGEAQLMNAAVAAVAPPAVALGVLRELRGSDRIGLGPVTGVITLYMLLGMMWAFVYGAIDAFGGQFFANGDPGTVSNCLYFSFVTLATVGYGDFTARSDLGHTLSVFEALLGQIYLVTVVSLIVGNLGRSRPRRAEPGKEPQ